MGENQDGGVSRHTVPPRTTRTDRESNGKGVQHQGNKSRGSNTHIRQNRLQKKGRKRDPEYHFIILKEGIHQEDINIVNIYAPKIKEPKYITNILENFNKDIDSTQL